MKKASVTVVGAGMSGLVAAYVLRKRGVAVEMIEKNHVGGLLETEETSYGPAEYAATSFLTSPILRELATLTRTQLIPVSAQAAKRRYICYERPERWPLSLTGSLRFAAGLPFAFPREGTNATFYDLCKKRFGQKFAQTIAEVATQGTFAARASELSGNLVRRYFSNSRALKKSGEFLCAPRGGFRPWTQSIYDWLIANGMAVQSEVAPSSSVVFAGSLTEAQTWSHAHVKDLSFLNEFAKLKSTTLTSTTFFFERSSFTAPYPGFGVLFNDPNILGLIQMSDVFPDLYSARAETWILRTLMDDREILEFRQKKMGLSSKPLATYSRKQVAKLPLYDRALEKFLNHRLVTPNIQFVGNYLGYIGLSGLSQQIEKQIDQFLETGTGCMA